MLKNSDNEITSTRMCSDLFKLYTLPYKDDGHGY